MTRLVWVLTAAAGLVAYQLIASCSNPLETTPEPDPPQIVNQVDTVRILALDTVFVADTGGCPDTLFITDTVLHSDTVVVVDSVIVTDSLVIGDTVVVIDSVVVTDTVVVIDSVVVSDSVIVVDTVVVTDSVVVPDSVVVTDTLVVTDTILSTDTLLVTDTVFHTDTVVVVERDTSGCGRMCDQFDSHQKEIVWLLDNTAGRYRLDFSGWAERDQPPQTLIVDIDGERHEWTVAELSELTVETDLALHAKIYITLDSPMAHGHSLAVCITVTPI